MMIVTNVFTGGGSRMATLIPSFGSCVSRMTSGERKLAERLEQKLDVDYLLKLLSLREEAFAIADQLNSAHQDGHAWGDMAILCADWKTMDWCADALHKRKLPFKVRKRSGDYNPAADAI